MKNKTLHEIAKFASGLVLGDFLTLWWLSSANLLPIRAFGTVWTQSIVVPGLIFDACCFIILIHYGWNLGRTPTLRTRTYFTVVGIILGVVALAHLLRVFTSADFVILGWTAPLWLSWVGVVVAAYLSYMSFRLATSFKK